MENFSYEPDGYNREEVNQFISDVIDKTEGIIKTCQRQKKDIERLQKELEHYKNMEISLNSTITSDKEIIEKAKNNASRIVNEALLKAEKTEAKRNLVEKNMKIFKRKLKIIIAQQQAVIDEIDELELSDE